MNELERDLIPVKMLAKNIQKQKNIALSSKQILIII